jgi:hypothetical protein
LPYNGIIALFLCRQRDVDSSSPKVIDDREDRIEKVGVLLKAVEKLIEIDICP